MLPLSGTFFGGNRHPNDATCSICYNLGAPPMPAELRLLDAMGEPELMEEELAAPWLLNSVLEKPLPFPENVMTRVVHVQLPPPPWICTANLIHAGLMWEPLMRKSFFPTCACHVLVEGITCLLSFWEE